MRCPFFIVFLPLCLIFSCRQIYAQEKVPKPSFQRFLNWTIEDPAKVIKDINKRDIGIFWLSGIGIAGSSSQDAFTSTHFQSKFRNSTYLNVANEAGTFRYVAPLSAAVFGTSLLTDDYKFQDAAFTSLQSLIYTKLTVDAAKFVFARERPDHFDGPYDFDFFEANATSFPSGHTSTAFALIIPWVVYYPNTFTYSLLALPVSTAIARVSKGKHWMSDVAAGAVIGTFWGYKLSKRHIKNPFLDNVDIAPYAGTKGGGLTINIAF